MDGRAPWLLVALAFGGCGEAENDELTPGATPRDAEVEGIDDEAVREIDEATEELGAAERELDEVKQQADRQIAVAERDVIDARKKLQARVDELDAQIRELEAEVEGDVEAEAQVKQIRERQRDVAVRVEHAPTGDRTAWGKAEDDINTALTELGRSVEDARRDISGK